MTRVRQRQLLLVRKQIQVPATFSKYLHTVWHLLPGPAELNCTSAAGGRKGWHPRTFKTTKASVIALHTSKCSV